MTTGGLVSHGGLILWSSILVTLGEISADCYFEVNINAWEQLLFILVTKMPLNLKEEK